MITRNFVVVNFVALISNVENLVFRKSIFGSHVRKKSLFCLLLRIVIESFETVQVEN